VKKRTKTFALLVRAAGLDARQREKVFCFFFSKKKRLLLPGAPSGGSL
jgi:hypothetical protein